MEYRKPRNYTPESANFWWNLLVNNGVQLPEQEIRQFFVERYPKKQFKIYYDVNSVRTKWHKNNYRKCHSIEDFKIATADRKTPTIEHIEVVYKKYIACRDEFDRISRVHQLLVMLTEYININCYDILQRGY